MPSEVNSLAAEKFVSLTTFKRNGDAVAGPMWIASDDGGLVMWTHADSWKVKRVRRDPRVTLVPCRQRGRVSGAEGVDYGVKRESRSVSIAVPSPRRKPETS